MFFFSYFPLYQSCHKFQIFDILRVSLAESCRIKTNPYRMVARADVILSVVTIDLGFSLGEVRDEKYLHQQ